MAKSTRRAKRILEEATPHVGTDVVVIAPGVNGAGYLSTSMPMATSQDLEDVITMTHEALKRLKHWHRARVREEQRAQSRSAA